MLKWEIISEKQKPRRTVELRCPTCKYTFTAHEGSIDSDLLRCYICEEIHVVPLEVFDKLI